MTGTIHSASLVTLHFRVALSEGGQVVLSTFDATPATLQLGRGELMPALEARLIGLGPGSREVFHFAPGEAFGAYQEDLVERVARSHIPPAMQIEQDAVYALPAPDGSSHPGLVRELTEQYALVDFNHPLAGKAVTVEVQIIGVI